MHTHSTIRSQRSSIDSVISDSTGFRKKIPSLISLFAIFAQQIFFSISGLVGYDYGGKTESPIYIQFIVLVFVTTVITYVRSFVKKPEISKSEIGFYVFFLFLIANHLLWVVIDGGKTPMLPRPLIFFLSLGIPGFMAARIIRVFDAWYELIRLSDLAVFFMSFGLVIAVVWSSYNSGLKSMGIGGATSQAASYYSAMCFGLLGFATFYLEKKFRYKWFRGRVGLMLSVLMMMALIVTVIMEGGRGAFILMVIYCGILFFWMANKHGMTRRGMIRYAAVALSLPIIISFAMYKVMHDPLLLSGFNRAVAYIGNSNGGLINMEGGSSGRDVVYSIDLKGIADSPWVGYGAFGVWDKVIMPHDLFLDLLLQFGVPIALILTVSVSLILWQKFKPLTTEKVWLLILFLYPMIMLLFSGEYLATSVFWFCLSSFLCLRKRKSVY